MNPTGARKSLLIAESELNRAQLVEDIAALTPAVRRFTDRTASFAAFASSAVALTRQLARSRGTTPGGGIGKLSRMQTVVRIGGMASTLWLAFCPTAKSQTEK